MPLLDQEETKNYTAADDSSVLPAGDYPVRIMEVARMDNRPQTIQFIFKISQDVETYGGRVIRAWTNTTPNAIWVLKRLLGELVDDVEAISSEDLEDHFVMAHVVQELRRDTDEMRHVVQRLYPCPGESKITAGAAAPAVAVVDSDDESIPF